jgi:hypothetical protein
LPDDGDLRTSATGAVRECPNAPPSAFGKISLTVSKAAPGTDPSGKIAVTDDMTDPKLQLAPVLEKVVENGLLLGLQEGVKRHYAGPPEKTAEQADPAPAVLEAKP